MDRGRPDAEGLRRFPDQPAGRGLDVGLAEDGLADEGIQPPGKALFIFDDDPVVLAFKNPLVRIEEQFEGIGGHGRALLF
jgi:hypothetical protein